MTASAPIRCWQPAKSKISSASTVQPSSIASKLKRNKTLDLPKSWAVHGAGRECPPKSGQESAPHATRKPGTEFTKASSTKCPRTIPQIQLQSKQYTRPTRQPQRQARSTVHSPRHSPLATPLLQSRRRSQRNRALLDALDTTD